MDLAYLVAAGKRRFRWAAATAIRCLRGPGGFTGEIRVFTDRPGRMPGAAQCIVVDDPADRAQPKWMKLHAARWIDFAAYDRVLFLDSDIVVRAPVAPFLDRCQAEDALLACDDLCHPIGHGMCARCLSPEERAAHGETTPGINSGFWCAPGARLADWLAAWEQILIDCADVPGPGFDQPGLNAAMLRGAIPVCRIDRQMWFPRRDPTHRKADPDAPIVHFHGIGRHLNRYLRMRRFARSLLRKHTPD